MSINVWDLKLGSGQVTKQGDTLELRFQVASSLANLDAGICLQSNWNPGDRAVYATLGKGQIRPEIDEALTGVPVGTNRRFSIPAGAWQDIDRDVIVGIDVGAIVLTPLSCIEECLFDDVASVIPISHNECADALNDKIKGLLDSGLQNGKKEKNKNTVRLMIPEKLNHHWRMLLEYYELKKIMKYSIEEIGLMPNGDQEVEMAIVDVDLFIRLLSKGDMR